MAMLFSPKVHKKEANKVDLLLKQAEAGSHPDKLLIENGRQLLSTVPDRVLAPKTESSEVCDRKVQESLKLLRAPLKPK